MKTSNVLLSQVFVSLCSYQYHGRDKTAVGDSSDNKHAERGQGKQMGITYTTDVLNFDMVSNFDILHRRRTIAHYSTTIAAKALNVT